MNSFWQILARIPGIYYLLGGTVVVIGLTAGIFVFSGDSTPPSNQVPTGGETDTLEQSPVEQDALWDLPNRDYKKLTVPSKGSSNTNSTTSGQQYLTSNPQTPWQQGPSDQTSSSSSSSTQVPWYQGPSQ
ncbi:MAG: hypothetical protein V1826_03125 [bacterium]